MAQRRLLQTLTRQAITALSSNPISLNHILKSSLPSLGTKTHNSVLSIINTTTTRHPLWPYDNRRCCSSESGRGSEIEDSEEEDSDAGEVTSSELHREYSPQEKEEEAAAIGYKVIGPLAENERVIKPYEPVFAVVQIGSHQFKVSNGDCIFTERLKFCDVNDKLILNKVLLVGSRTQTIVGRPIVPDSAVHAIVEEHALDAKVIVFKKKRRKNYRRTKGHRQELTKLRITDIQGIEKPEKKVITKHKKIGAKKQEKVPVAA